MRSALQWARKSRALHRERTEYDAEDVHARQGPARDSRTSERGDIRTVRTVRAIRTVRCGHRIVQEDARVDDGWQNGHRDREPSRGDRVSARCGNDRHGRADHRRIDEHADGAEWRRAFAHLGGDDAVRGLRGPREGAHGGSDGEHRDGGRAQEREVRRRSERAPPSGHIDERHQWDSDG